MLKIFTSMEALLCEVQADRHIEGDGASTANRFPVRFVLFDNFRDCCTFVGDCSHIPNITPVRDKNINKKVGNLANILYLYR